MQEGTEREILISCRNHEGEPVRGEATRIARHLISFNVYRSSDLVLLSGVFEDFQIFFGTTLAYRGRATLSSLVNTGFMLVCEATLQDEWVDEFTHLEGGRSAWVKSEFHNVVEEWKKTDAILPEFKTLISDMHSYLLEIKRWMDEAELSLPDGGAENRQVSQDILGQASSLVKGPLDEVMSRFQGIADGIDVEEEANHRNHGRRVLHPLILSSPFVWRAYSKPLGYAGDYEVVNLILGEPFQGPNLFGKLINAQFVAQPPAVAHQNRIDFLVERLEEETERCRAQGRKCRILDIGCGPAVQIQRFLGTPLADHAEFTLVDFNDETVEKAVELLSEIAHTMKRSTKIEVIQKSIQGLIKLGSTPGDEPYDFIYIAGLFDYLSHRVCAKILEICFEDLAPGGLLAATNVETSNPRRKMMEHFFEWHLIHRDRQEFKDLAPGANDGAEVEISTDSTGVNIFLEVRKPEPAS